MFNTWIFRITLEFEMPAEERETAKTSLERIVLVAVGTAALFLSLGAYFLSTLSP